jgi:hypothetical protein
LSCIPSWQAWNTLMQAWVVGMVRHTTTIRRG